MIIAGDIPILPMQFGTIVDEEEKTLAMLRNYYHDFVENLQRVKGKVELGVKILWEPNEIRGEIVDLNEKIKMIIEDLLSYTADPGQAGLDSDRISPKIDGEAGYQKNRGRIPHG